MSPLPRPLRVLLLNERCHLNPLAGGAEVHLFEIFGRIAQAGVEVELLCSGFEGAAPRDAHRGVVVTRVGSRMSFYAQVPGEVRRRVATGSVDLVVEAHNKVPFLVPMYAHVPVLVIHHHLHGWTAFRQVSAPIAAVSVALEKLIPWVYRRVPFLTISKSSKSDLVRRGLREESVDVVPCGIDHDLFVPAPLAGRPPTVITLGRLEPYKRLDLLIAAMQRVVVDVPAAQLVIVGRGQERPRLEALTRRLGLENHVTFAGFVSDVRKVALLQQAALMVQCSEKEGWGLTVTEAYACGTPVVARDVPGLSDSVQDGVTGLLVRHGKPAPLAAAISKLLLDEDRRLEMAASAQEWSRRFRWDTSARAVLSAMRCAVGRLAATESLKPAVPSSVVGGRVPLDAGVLS